MHFGLSSIHWKWKFMINAFQVEDFQTLHSVCLYPLCLRSDSVPSLTCVLFSAVAEAAKYLCFNVAMQTFYLYKRRRVQQ